MGEFFGSLGKSYVAGGIFMHFISLTGVVMLAILAERVFFLWIKSGFNKTGFLEQMRKFIAENNIDGAIAFCKEKKDALSNIIRAGLAQFREGDPDFKDAMDLAALANLPELERRTGYLAMLGNVATLLGLLGTINGLIQAFESVAAVDASQKAAALAAGISTAMLTTAYGLIIAIPSLVAFSVIQGKTQKLVEGIEESAATVATFLDRRAQRPS